jgi:hypothetical protein
MHQLRVKLVSGYLNINFTSPSPTEELFALDVSVILVFHLRYGGIWCLCGGSFAAVSQTPDDQQASNESGSKHHSYTNLYLCSGTETIGCGYDFGFKALVVGVAVLAGAVTLYLATKGLTYSLENASTSYVCQATMTIRQHRRPLEAS